MARVTPINLKRKRMMAAYSAGTASEAMYAPHPYLNAERLFCTGRIPVAQAIGMILSDPDYIAECELTGKDKAAYAEAIVRGTWARVLLETSNG
jgi:hypothetical protein